MYVLQAFLKGRSQSVQLAVCSLPFNHSHRTSPTAPAALDQTYSRTTHGARLPTSPSTPTASPWSPFDERLLEQHQHRAAWAPCRPAALVCTNHRRRRYVYHTLWHLARTSADSTYSNNSVIIRSAINSAPLPPRQPRFTGVLHLVPHFSSSSTSHHRDIRSRSSWAYRKSTACVLGQRSRIASGTSGTQDRFR